MPEKTVEDCANYTMPLIFAIKHIIESNAFVLRDHKLATDFMLLARGDAEDMLKKLQRDKSSHRRYERFAC